MKISGFIIFCALILTGCSSSPSSEYQTKLLEYEKCIAGQETVFTLMLQAGTRDEVLSILGVVDEPIVSKFIEKCKKYRP